MITDKSKLPNLNNKEKITEKKMNRASEACMIIIKYLTLISSEFCMERRGQA